MKLVSIACFCLAGVAYPQTLSNANYYADTLATGLVVPTTAVFVSPNTFLYASKNTGTVRFVTNGVTMGTALTVPVANQGEMGALGLVLDPNFPINQRVYFYYSRAETLGGTWTDDRVERYIWNGAQLLFDGLIASWPSSSSLANAVDHHGGLLRIGPDGTLYVQRGDVGRNVSIEANTNTTLVSDATHICRLNLNGTIPSDNPFSNHSNPNIQRVYVYGQRNGFGMDIDSVTGRLWFTENGPDKYDEINVATSGMNSGWLKIMGPDVRDATYGANGNTPYNASDLIYLPGATYADPVFSWLNPIGVTGICFLQSNKFPLNQGDVIVGNTNLGTLYLFPVNATRDGFILSGGLSDTVADNTTERNVHLFGSGFGLITDIFIGPDGYAHVISLGHGAIYRIRPKVETIYPTNVSTGPGAILFGNLSSLLQSDDDRLVMRPTAIAIATIPPVQLTLEGVSPFLNPSDIKLRLESNSSIANCVQKVSLYDYQSSGWVEIDSRTISLADTTIELTAPNPARFVSSTRQIKALVTFKNAGPVAIFPWQARMDEFYWTISL